MKVPCSPAPVQHGGSKVSKPELSGGVDVCLLPVVWLMEDTVVLLKVVVEV